MNKTVPIRHKVSLKLSVLLLLLFTVAAGVYCYYSYRSITSVYHVFFNEKALLTNRIVTTQISAADVQSYIDRISSDEEFKQKELEFFHTREALLALRKEDKADPKKIAELTAKIRQFYADCEKYKDAKYYEVLQRLVDLKRSSGAKYVYVFADTGVSGMYTYIFDADDHGPDSLIDADGLGTVGTIEYIGAEVRDIIDSGKPMEQAMPYSHELYGDLFYAYAPILDASGKTVALVGTDISVEEMNEQIYLRILLDIIMFFVLGALSVVGVFFFLKYTILLPVTLLTETATKISEGAVYTPIPSKVLESRSELGVLARAIHAMSAVYQNMITVTKDIFEAAMIGKLGVRNDPSLFKGDISKVIEQINGALDAVTLYFNNIHEALFIADQDFEVMFANKQFIRLFGHPDAKRIFQTLLPDSLDATCSELHEKLRKSMLDGIYSVTLWLPTQGGKQACFAITACTIELYNDSRSSILVLASDVTDLMREKENAQAASIAKSEFLSRISHELRTPMNVIIGMVTLGLNDCAPPSCERLKKIDTASRHLLGIINDVLDMSRIEAGRMEIREDNFSVCTLLSDCAGLFVAQMEEKNLTLVTECSAVMPHMLHGDSQHIRQVLLNLLSNAVKFTEKGGQVFLKANVLEQSVAGCRVEFSVQDTGTGMEAEFLGKVFEPFEQADGSLQRRYQGTGLGLPISKNLVVLMGGSIRVESTPGLGSTFIFELTLAPAEENSEFVQTESDHADVAIAGMHIMLVDDIAINRFIFMEMLEKTEVQITEASSGAEALTLFADSLPGTYDLIFMDIQMPEMDGYEATKAIRSLSRQDALSVPIVAMTANAMQQDIEQAMGSGMNAHLAKPVDFEACLRLIRKYRHDAENNA